MKRPKRFEDPEDVVMSKLIRGPYQSQPQPAPGVQERRSVLSRVGQAPAPSFPLHTIDEGPGNFVTIPSSTVDYDILSHPQPRLGAPSIQLQAPVTVTSHQESFMSAPVAVHQYSGRCGHQ